MNKKKMFALVVLGIIVTSINVLIGLVMIKVLWSTIAEALLSNLIVSGQITASMSWKDAFWIGILLYVVIRAFSGKLLTVTNKNGSTTISMGDLSGNANQKDSENKNENNKD
tara:strand:+ start:304 stop:639 length:336 start_codon:yes stop_codon:yes gene_type:complete